MPYATEAWDKPGIQRSIKRPIVGAPCPIPQRLGTNQESNVPFNACLVGKPCPTPLMLGQLTRLSAFEQHLAIMVPRRHRAQSFAQ